jgi:hypothetical protein
LYSPMGNHQQRNMPVPMSWVMLALAGSLGFA